MIMCPSLVVTPYPYDTQYYPFFALSNQTSQNVTHPNITLTEARLTVEYF
jgi:hypothetical protein